MRYVPLLENNFPIWQSHVDKLSKLVLDSDDKYTLKTGEKLDLGNGYSFLAKQVDVDGKKVWLEFDKDGQYVDDKIVSTDTGDHTWTCVLDNIQGVENVPVLKVCVNQVFQGAVDSIAQIKGLWLIDYANAMTLEIGDQFGNLTLTQIVKGIDASNLGGLVFEPAILIFNVKSVNYQCQYWGQYPVIDLFGERYVPLLENDYSVWQSHVDKLSKLVLDSKDMYTLKTGEKLDLGAGYSLEVKQVDIDGKKVWLEFDKDGQYVDDNILSVDNGSDKTWTCILNNILGVNNVPVLKVHVKQITQGEGDSIVQIDCLWLIDYANAMTLEIGNQFGNLTLTQIVKGVDASNLGSLIFESAFLIVNVNGIDYQHHDWGQYQAFDLFGVRYVPLLENNFPIWQSHVDKLSKLVLDSDDKYTLKTGEKLDLGNGYSLLAKQVDVDGKKVWLEFDKDGQYVDDKIVSTDTGDHTWTCVLDNIQGVENVPVLKVCVNQVFQGAVDSIT